MSCAAERVRDPRTRRPALALLVTWALAVVLGGCGTTDTTGGGRVLTVFAAASLTDVFGELERRFEAEHPGVDVVVSSGGSADLAQQVVNGAPADVLVTASRATMDVVVREGLTEGTPRVLATNVLQIAVPPDNPGRITTFADLAREDVVVVVCAPAVPCGAAAKKAEQAFGVQLRPVSEEPDVRSVLGKVLAGEADAGLVYVTDVRTGAGKVLGVPLPDPEITRTSYPITVIRGTPQPELARQFVEFTHGPAGRQVLEAAGFGVP